MAATVPSYDKLFNPILKALHKLGGSASIQELVNEIIALMNISEDVAEIQHGKSALTELEYRAAWARTYLKNFGLIENSGRAIWSLTSKGRETQSVEPKEVVRFVQRKHKEARSVHVTKTKEIPGADIASEEEINVDWRGQMIGILYKIPPDAFERLCQRLLREAGFIEVEVTGRSGDGGIDGHGTMRIGGLISFNVLFQSKRYQKNIGPDVVRDFRGAMIGRADKGLIITTGGFTRDARKEATRDGAPPIDLIDGELLVEKLKELGLGVEVKMVESVTVKSEWFAAV